MIHIVSCLRPLSYAFLYTYIRSLQDAFVKIVRHEGIKSLWSGLPPTLWVWTLLMHTTEHMYWAAKIDVCHELTWICCAWCSVMAVPATVIYFTCYDQLCVALKARMGGHTDMAPLFAGAIARGEQCFLMWKKLNLNKIYPGRNISWRWVWLSLYVRFLPVLRRSGFCVTSEDQGQHSNTPPQQSEKPGPPFRCM